MYQYEKYTDRAGANSVRKLLLQAPRGIIFDRFNIPLVDNLQIYDFSVIPFDVTKNFNYDLISQKLNLNANNLLEKINNKKKSFYRFRPYKIKNHINFSQKI